MKKLIPETIENKIPSNKFVYFFTWLLVAFNFFRSLEHIFNDDGGAQSIAGIPLDFYIPEASNNIISIFAQWGFSQLVLSCLLLLVVLTQCLNEEMGYNIATPFDIEDLKSTISQLSNSKDEEKQLREDVDYLSLIHI